MSDLFDDFSFKEGAIQPSFIEFEDYNFRTGRRRRERCPVGPTMVIGGYYGILYVSIRPHVLERLAQQTVVGGVNDRISFQVTPHGGGATGRALVTAQNSTIIGSSWLGYVYTWSVPSCQLPRTDYPRTWVKHLPAEARELCEEINGFAFAGRRKESLDAALVLWDVLEEAGATAKERRTVMGASFHPRMLRRS